MEFLETLVSLKIPFVSEITDMIMKIVDAGDKGLPELMAKINGLDAITDKIGSVMGQLSEFTLNIDFSGLTGLIDGISKVFGA